MVTKGKHMNYSPFKNIFLVSFIMVTTHNSFAAKQMKTTQILNNNEEECSVNDSPTYSAMYKQFKVVDLSERVTSLYTKGHSNSAKMNFKGCDDTTRVSTLSAIKELDLIQEFNQVSDKVSFVFPNISLQDLVIKTSFCSSLTPTTQITGHNKVNKEQLFTWRPKSRQRPNTILKSPSFQKDQINKTDSSWKLISQLLHAKVLGRSHNIRQGQIDIIIKKLKSVDLNNQYDVDEARQLSKFFKTEK